VTEKLNGSNGLVSILKQPLDEPKELATHEGWTYNFTTDDARYSVAAGSRNRWLSPNVKGQDNMGFALWVQEHAQELALTLGEGKHYGEWFGSGVQGHDYGLSKGDKRWALFNANRWSDVEAAGVPGLTVVPVLFEGTPPNGLDDRIAYCLDLLREWGSIWSFAHGLERFDKPEGIVVWHQAARQNFKITLEDDAMSKTQALREAALRDFANSELVGAP
jgi:hypothetical protein